MTFLKIVLLGDAAHLEGDSVHGEEPAPTVADLCAIAASGLHRLLEERLGVFGDETVLPRPVGHLTDAGVVNVVRGEAFPQVLLHLSDVLLVHFDVQFRQDLVHTAGTGGRLQQQLGQVLAAAIEHLTQYVEHLVAAQGVANLLQLGKEPREHPAFAGVLGHQVEYEDLFRLPVTMDAAHALLQPVGIPGDVVVDHQVAELEVDALARGLGGHHHLGLVLEHPLGVDALFQPHPTVDGADGVPPLADAPLQVRERVAGLGEDENLGAGSPHPRPLSLLPPRLGGD